MFGLEKLKRKVKDMEARLFKAESTLERFEIKHKVNICDLLNGMDRDHFVIHFGNELRIKNFMVIKNKFYYYDDLSNGQWCIEHDDSIYFKGKNGEVIFIDLYNM